MANRAPDAGFTLIEALVAMAILAVGAVALIGAAESHAARLAGVEDRVAGRWIAANALTAHRLGLPEMARADALGRGWTVALEVAPTADPGLVRLDVSVMPEDGGPLVVLIGFAQAP